MRTWKDIKIPKFKIPKFKMNNISEIDEFNVDYEDLKKKVEEKGKRPKNNYNATRFNTIKEMFDNSIKEYNDKICVLEKFEKKGDFEEITYNKFGEDTIALGTALIEILKLKNQKIIIIGETTYHWYLSYMALLCGAGVAVPIDKELPANEIVNLINRSNATAVIYSTKKKDIIKKVEEDLSGVKFFIQMNSDQELDGKDVGIDYLIELGKKSVKNGNTIFENIEINPEEFKLLIFTSGTTSDAKGVMISNKNLASNLFACSSYVNLKSDDRLLSILPLHHTYESTIGFLYPFSVGASVAVCEGLKYIVQNLKETKPTSLLTVPALIENLYKKINANIKKSKKDKMVNSMIHVTNALKMVNVDVKRKVFTEIYETLGGNIRYIVSAAAPIDVKIGKWLEDIGITFLQGYGLTETAPIAALTPDFQTKVGSAGKPVVCAKIKIDSQSDKPEGEVLINSDTLMIGYYENEEATKEAIEVIDGERWFHTGDIGYLDSEGFLYLTGRSKNVIVTQNGKNIYPEEIELLLGDVSEIKECMVYGKESEDKKDKELVISAKVIPNYDEIKKKYGVNLDDNQIHDIIWEEVKKVNKKLTSYKAIKNLEIKKDEFEKTTTMKIKRYAEIRKNK